MKMEPKYYVEASYEGHDSDFDYQIESRVGREASTGYSFYSGRRDLIFYFVRKDAAERTLKKLSRFKKYKFKVKLDLIEDIESY